MNETTCWYCDRKIEYEGEKYQDVICPFCKIMNSIYDPSKKETEIKPKSSYDEYLANREEKKDMANLGDLRKNLRKEDVQTGDVITFVDAGEIKDVDFSPAQDGSEVKTVFQALIELPDGKNKLYTPNATTRGILSDKWTEDTEKWVGKKATVKFVDQLSFGKLTKVMILETIE